VRTALGQATHARGDTEPFSPALGAVGELLAGDDSQELIAAFRRSAPGWLLQYRAPILARSAKSSRQPPHNE
jgi:hypothetical protein